MNVHATETKSNVVEVDPDAVKPTYGCELGETIELILKSDVFDVFEIIFEESCPPNAPTPLTGSTKHRISIPMPDTKSQFKGHIIFKKHGTLKGKPVPFLAESCVGCGQ
jgi:hypothetical protein